MHRGKKASFRVISNYRKRCIPIYFCRFRGLKKEREREQGENMSRLCIYFCNTLPRDFAPRYLPPLRTISTRVISFQRGMGIRTMHTGVHCPTEPTVCSAARPLLSFKLSPPRLGNAKFVLNTKRF